VDKSRPLGPVLVAHARIGPMTARFLSLADVAEVLNISTRQARSLVTSGELRGLQIGGRGIWRVAAEDLDAYIQAGFESTAERIEARSRAKPES
jgi:excisionase family DNA binding protein